MNSSSKLSCLDDLVFDNRFIRELPGDPEAANFRRQVAGACFSRVLPAKVSSPQLVAHSKEVADLLDLSPELCASAEFTQVFSGNRLARGMEPYAMCYGGHQFGYWAGQLGDGRAINLGEVINRHGERWILQLKGAGPTPYSRSADGLAVLRSSIREFLCSEAMHHLGIPTTRALSVVLTGEAVIRDMFYNGNPKPEPGAIVCRVAPSFIRFGNFQILAARGEIDLLRQFVDYTIRVDFPHLGEPLSEVYVDWFQEVCRRTAEMIVHWQRVGFVHGVMNTDNMSILGLTIDYGPYGWLENFDPHWTPNTTDAEERRYRFGQQPQIAYWNLGQLANALYPLFGEAEPLQAGMRVYAETFDREWQRMMSAKLGFAAFCPETDGDLIAELQVLLQKVETDMTLFFRALAELNTREDSADWELQMSKLLQGCYYVPEQITSEYRQRLSRWLCRYRQRLCQDGVADEMRRSRMHAVNPKYVLRNYLAQLAIDKAEQGDFTVVSELLDLLRRPYEEQPDRSHYAAKRPDWARSRPGCSMLSCSS
ncbi:MAG: YdiU family protein [Methylococcaceae bacterium]|nr:YdiU family protein [Methylococcaceae bacterium]